MTPPSDDMPTTTTPATIYTVGHSTRSFDDLVGLIQAHGVRAVADVRAIPRSRRFPHFNDESLAAELPRRGVEYRPFVSLGGRRKPTANSTNTGWRNASFRAYADYMQTEPFTAALEQLMAAARERPTTVMCSEAVPWRCHRSLIADALLVRGWRVLDIMSATKAGVHKLTPFAVVEGTQIAYPAGDGPDLFARNSQAHDSSRKDVSRGRRV